MALENARYIAELDSNNPDGNDPPSQGDDHIRNVKASLENGFPGFVGTQVSPKGVTLTEDQINDAALKSEVNTFTDVQEHQASVRLANGIPLYARETDGTLRFVAQVTAGDRMDYGDSNLPVRMQGQSIEFLNSGVQSAVTQPRANGSLLVHDRNGNLKKTGFRNPSFDSFTSRTVTQDDEGRVLTPSSAGQTLTLDALELFTSFRIRTGGNGCELASGTASITWLKGGTVQSGGTVTILPYSIVEVYYPNTNTADIFGNGIT